MSQDTFRTLIVSAAAVEQMRSLASTWTGGVGMWERPLYQDSAEPTHYISSGLISPTIAAWLPHSDWSRTEDDWEETSHPGDLGALVAVVNTNHPDENITLEMAEALVPQVDISTQSAQQAMERMGLSFLPTMELEL